MTLDDLEGLTFADKHGNTVVVGERLADGRYKVRATYGRAVLSAATIRQLYPRRKEA